MASTSNLPYFKINQKGINKSKFNGQPLDKEKPLKKS